MSSGDEFDKLMSSLSEDFGSEIVKDFEGLDKLRLPDLRCWPI